MKPVVEICQKYGLRLVEDWAQSHGWVQICYVSEWIAPIINLLVSVPLNFLINKFWAFKKEEK